MLIQKVERRNGNGVKDSVDMYRTFNGAHHVAWLIHPSAERIAAYRAAGIRCRRVKDELFVHIMDTEQALDIDRAAGD